MDNGNDGKVITQNEFKGAVGRAYGSFRTQNEYSASSSSMDDAIKAMRFANDCKNEEFAKALAKRDAAITQLLKERKEIELGKESKKGKKENNVEKQLKFQKLGDDNGDYKSNAMRSAMLQENMNESKLMKYATKLPQDNINKEKLLSDINQDMMNQYMFDANDVIGAEAARQARLSNNHLESKQRQGETSEEFEERKAIKEYANDKRKSGNSEDLLKEPLFNKDGSISPFYLINNDSINVDDNGDADIDMNGEKGKEKEKEKAKEKSIMKQSESSISGNGCSDDYYKQIKKDFKKGYTVVSSSSVRDNAIDFNNDHNGKLVSPFPYRDPRAFGMSKQANSELTNMIENEISKNMVQSQSTKSKKSCNVDARMRRMSAMIPPASTTASAGIESAPNTNEPRDSMPIFNQT